MERFLKEKASRRAFLTKGCLFLTSFGIYPDFFDLLTKKAWVRPKTCRFRGNNRLKPACAGGDAIPVENPRKSVWQQQLRAPPFGPACRLCKRLSETPNHSDSVLKAVCGRKENAAAGL